MVFFYLGDDNIIIYFFIKQYIYFIFLYSSIIKIYKI